MCAQAAELLSKHQPNFATALAAYNEKRGVWESLTLETLARPLDDAHVAAGSLEAVVKARRAKIDDQISLWARAIAFERKNSQHFEAGPLADRVRLVYRQALNCLRFLPDLWCALACPNPLTSLAGVAGLVCGFLSCVLGAVRPPYVVPHRCLASAARPLLPGLCCTCFVSGV